MLIWVNIVRTPKGDVLNMEYDCMDLPEKNEEQCEFCGRFFINLQKHKDIVHGKNQTKLFDIGENGNTKR